MSSRDDMLKELSTLDYRVFWPNAWEDVGFTEREMWVNGAGYGYFSCDEPNGRICVLEPFDTKRWKNIKEKMKNDSLTLMDVVDTPLEPIFEDYYTEDDTDFSRFNHLLDLTDEASSSRIYGIVFGWEIRFFSEAKDALEARKRDNVDVKWTDLPDNELALWIERLHSGEVEAIDPFVDHL